MTKFELIRRNIRFFRRSNLALAAGAAVACAVLTGAMMVGDSVRDSLRDLTIQRLHPIDHALTGPVFFGESLARRLTALPGWREQFGHERSACHAGIILRGGASNTNETLRAAGVQIAAFGADLVPVEPGQCVIDGLLADQLGAGAGDTIILNLPAAGDLPAGAALARVSRADRTTRMPLTVAQVRRQAAGDGQVDWFAARFSLAPTQRPVSKAWVNLQQLQDFTNNSGRANTLLVQAPPDRRDQPAADALQAMLPSAMRLDDYGLRFAEQVNDRPLPDTLAALVSANTYLNEPVERAADLAASDLHLDAQKVLVHLVNDITVSRNGQPVGQTHYAVAAGIAGRLPADLARTLEPGTIALNDWAFNKNLHAVAGDTVRLTYYERQADGSLEAKPSDEQFTVLASVPAMDSLGGDRTLTPEYKGLTDRASFADWQPPEGMKIDESLADEPYWRQYRAAPKLLLNLDDAQRLWGKSFGRLTSIRLPAEQQDAFGQALLEHLLPADMGMVFRPVLADQLAASSGSTDFGQLFLGLSMFLIGSAALLVALLFRLSVEQRSSQYGLLAALGFSSRSLRLMGLAEGMLVAVIGSLAGLGGAAGYTWAMMAGLRTWWIGAVGTSAMRLHVVASTLWTGLAVSLALAAAAILWGVWRLGRETPAALLSGTWSTSTGTPKRRGRVGPIAAGSLTMLGAALLATGALDGLDAPTAFMSGGAAMLVASLVWLGWIIRPRRRAGARLAGAMPLERLGFRNAGRHPSRSALTMGLLAFATFTLVTVAAFRQGPPSDTRDRTAGSGGYTLRIDADIPLPADPGTLHGRKVMGFTNPSDPAWDKLQFMPMRRRDGQDISCLNLNRAINPTILSVNDPSAWRGRFAFARTIEKIDDPWTLLDGRRDGAIPVIADDETARYILKLGVGESMDFPDDRGQSRKLTLVGTLAFSIFQGELLMGDANFRKLFGDSGDSADSGGPAGSGASGGFGVVLVRTPADDVSAARKALSSELGGYAAGVEPTAELLARFLEVANTYLSTFQVLGALGLMLGAAGLAVVLLRGLIERKSELALLTALGFTPGAKVRLVLAENALLLVLGLAAGVVCALIGAAPNLIATARTINAAALAGTLASVLAIAMLVLVLTTWLGQRSIKPADLRRE